MVFLQSICCATPAFNFCRTSASLFNFILSAPISVRALEPGGRCCVEVILLPCAYLPLLQTYLREAFMGSCVLESLRLCCTALFCSFLFSSMQSADLAFAWCRHPLHVHFSLPPSSETHRGHPNRRNTDHTLSRDQGVWTKLAWTSPKRVFLAAVAASIACPRIDLHLSTCE